MSSDPLRRLFLLRGLLALAPCALGFPSPANAAQESAAEADEGVLATVTVMARKREETLLEIPESVATISAETIEHANISGLEDISFLVSNLSLSQRADGFPNVSIRGLGSFGNTQGVGFYIDDVQNFTDASSRFGDVERIEVLKGPQGTLYGGSNIGGAIRFVTARPDVSEFFGRVKGTAGEQNLRDVEALLNLPLGESAWGLRLFYYIDWHEAMDSHLIFKGGSLLFEGIVPTVEEEATVLDVVPFENRARDREQYAAFGTASYRFGNLEIGGGARIDNWRAFTLNRETGLSGEREETEFLPRASITYFLDEDDSNIYANVSQGFEPGGFNLANFAGSNVLFGYGPETATSYELGYKARFLGGRVTFTLAGFKVDYRDRQFELQTTDPATGNIVEGILNAGDSEQYGAEFDLSWLITDSLTLSLGGGFVDAEHQRRSRARNRRQSRHYGRRYRSRVSCRTCTR